MIKEIPVNEDHLEADLEQHDMFISEWWDEPERSEQLTHYYKEWRQTIRDRGFRYINMLSNKDTRVITVIFCRCHLSTKIGLPDPETLINGQDRIKAITKGVG